MNIPKRQWRSVSLRACEHADQTLRDMQKAGVKLPGPISDKAWELMDLVAVIAEDDAYWRGLSPSQRFNTRNPRQAREFLRRTVREAS